MSDPGCADSLYYKNNMINYVQTNAHLNEFYIKGLNLIDKIEEDSKIRRKKEDKITQDHQTLEGFFQEYKLNVSFNELVGYLTKVFLLTKYKIHPLGFSPRIDYKKLQNDLGVSKDLCHRMVRNWQCGVAKYSSSFIEKIAKNNSTLIPLLKKIDDDGREVLPSFFVMKNLINFLIESKINLLLIVRSQDASSPILKIAFRPQNNNFEEMNHFFETDPHFVAHLISKQTKNLEHLYQKISETDVEQILLASVANHPQYTGRKLAFLNSNPYQKYLEELSLQDERIPLLKQWLQDYLDSLNYAYKSGCDYQNPTFVFVEHMFIDTPKHQNTYFNDLVSKYPVVGSMSKYVSMTEIATI